MTTHRISRPDEMPDHGQVIVGHPSREAAVAREATRQELDYFLTTLCPPTRIYTMNADQLREPHGLTWPA